MPKPLVLSDIRNRAGAFVSDWRDAEGYEKGEAQEFVRGFLRCLGISGRSVAQRLRGRGACSECLDASENRENPPIRH